jgi:hypothetical protein
MRSYPPEAKQDDRSDRSSADDGNTDGVAAITDLKIWSTDKQSLCQPSGDNRKYARQYKGHQQARSGSFKGLHRLFNNFFQN